MASMMNMESVDEAAEIYDDNLTETYDGEDKEGRSKIKIVKDILEIVELTISEIKELQGIIISKKRVFEWESEPIQLQTESQRCDGREVCSPQLPKAAVEQIFSSLSTKDVLSSRLVCQYCRQAATMELRKRIRQEISFRRDYQRDKTIKLLEVMKTSQLIPVTSFTLNMEDIQDKDFHLVTTFFQIFGPVMETLCVDFTGSTVDPMLFDQPLKMFLAGIQLGSLLNLTVIVHENVVPASVVDIRASLISAYFGSAKNLEKLTFDSENSILLLRSLENGTAYFSCSILFLETLILRDKELEKLGRVVKLKRLSLRFHFIQFKPETMKGFFQSQSETLEYLKLFPYDPSTGFKYEFPRIERLNVLSIEKVSRAVNWYVERNGVFSSAGKRLDDDQILRFARIDWNECFPKLKEFKMRGGFEDHWMESLFPSYTSPVPVHHELKILDFPIGIRRDHSMDFSVVNRIFPNIQTIKFSIHDLIDDLSFSDLRQRYPRLRLDFSRSYEDPFLSDTFPNMKKIVLHYEKDLSGRQEPEKYGLKNYLKEFAWGVILTPGIKRSYQRLTTAAIENKFDEYNYPHYGDEMVATFVRKSFDCTWFLRLFRERVRLEELSPENLDTSTADGGSKIGLSSYNVKKEHDWMNAGNLGVEKAAIAEEFRFRKNPAEMKQREENGPRFKVMKRIVENIPLTISEMEEFRNILVGKKRACEREAERTKEMETASGEVFVPPLPDLVLEKIFACPSLSTKDILSSRLVCRHWRSLATKELRKRICKFLTISWNCSEEREDLKKFLKVMKKSQLLPVASFNINWISIADKRQSHEIKNFFKIFGPILTLLKLDFYTLTRDLFDPERKSYLQEGQQTQVYFRENLNIKRLKKLESLEFNFIDDSLYSPPPWLRTEDARTSFFSVCFGSAQNLKKLKFESDGDLVGLVRSLENVPLPHLNTLILSIHSLSDLELESLSIAVKLKRLTLKIELIEFESETMKGFLRSQSETLEYLKLFPYECLTKFVYEFPRMENLKVFYIHNGYHNGDPRFSQIEWNESFPKLEELKLNIWEGGIRKEIWEKSLFQLIVSTSSKHMGLKIIDLNRGGGTGERPIRVPSQILLIGQIFPNVHTLKISSQDFPNPIPLDAFPNLKKIIFRLPYERSRENGKNYMKRFVWDMKLDFRILTVVDDYFARLTEIGFEVKEYVSGKRETWKTYDCTWFLSLLQDRIKLEQLDEELKAEVALKKGFAVLNFDCGDAGRDF